MIRFRFLAVVVALTLAGCGSTPEERGISGAGIGAAGGAILGAVTGLTVVEAAVIGAAIGGVAGALTDKETIDLGEPVWKTAANPTTGQSHVTGQSHAAAASNSELVRSIQSSLADRGFDPGPVDGVMGPRTAGAIRRYQARHDLLADGQASWQLAQHIEQQAD